MTQWDCDAYGPGASELGALCFISQHSRICPSLERCKQTMAGVRETVHARISHLAREGDEMAEWLLQEFPTPDELLGGDMSPGLRSEPLL